MSQISVLVGDLRHGFGTGLSPSKIHVAGAPLFMLSCFSWLGSAHGATV